MTQEEKYNLIEQFLGGEMSPVELAAFEEMLEADEALQAELRLHRELAASLGGEKIHAFRATLNEVDEKWSMPKKQNVKKAPVIKLSTLASIAAGILFLVIAIRLLMPQNNVSDETLFASNFEPYRMVLNQRTNTQEEPEIGQRINQAVAAYERKDFEGASDAFRFLQTTTPDAMVFRFYTAISEMSLGQPTKAIPIWKELLADGSQHLLMEQSRWYLALAYLQNNELEKSKTLLQQIPTGAYKYDEARELLASLD